MRFRLTLLAGAVAVCASSGPAFAAPCAGASPFGDVLAADTACTNIEWLANRGISVGCGGGNFCPGDFVVRKDMALFMNRLADAVVGQPTVRDTVPGALVLDLLAATNVICQTAVIPAVNYPRTFVAHGHATFRSSGAVGDVGIHLMNTVDGATTNWIIATGNSQRTSTTSVSYGAVSHQAVIQVNAGQSVVVGIGTFSVMGNVNMDESRCQVTVTQQSRTGSATPFDPPLWPAVGDGF